MTKYKLKKNLLFFWQIQNMIIMNSWQLFAVLKLKERELERSRLQSALVLFSSWLDSSESFISCYNFLAGQVVLRFLFHDVVLQIAMK